MNEVRKDAGCWRRTDIFFFLQDWKKRWRQHCRTVPAQGDTQFRPSVCGTFLVFWMRVQRISSDPEAVRQAGGIKYPGDSLYTNRWVKRFFFLIYFWRCENVSLDSTWMSHGLQSRQQPLSSQEDWCLRGEPSEERQFYSRLQTPVRSQVSACFSSQLQFSLTLKCIIAVILLYYVIFLNIKYILKSAMLHVVLLGLHLPVVMIWSYFNLFFKSLSSYFFFLPFLSNGVYNQQSPFKDQSSISYSDSHN